jgi:hypothetical protein
MKGQGNKGQTIFGREEDHQEPWKQDRTTEKQRNGKAGRQQSKLGNSLQLYPYIFCVEEKLKTPPQGKSGGFGRLTDLAVGQAHTSCYP